MTVVQDRFFFHGNDVPGGLLFAATEDGTGTELWFTDGVTTRLVADLEE